MTASEVFIQRFDSDEKSVCFSLNNQVWILRFDKMIKFTASNGHFQKIIKTWFTNLQSEVQFYLYREVVGSIAY